jgi:hypothetical protein
MLLIMAAVAVALEEVENQAQIQNLVLEDLAPLFQSQMEALFFMQVVAVAAVLTAHLQGALEA